MRVRVPVEIGLDAASMAAVNRLAAAIEALASGAAKVPDPLEYATSARVRVWASQFDVAISPGVTFEDIARVNTKRQAFSQPPFVLKAAP